MLFSIETAAGCPQRWGRGDPLGSLNEVERKDAPDWPHLPEDRDLLRIGPLVAIVETRRLLRRISPCCRLRTPTRC